MRLLNLEIHNFRGIQKANIDFPSDNRFICLIGSGDSTKSTILLSIEWLFAQTWNLPVCDNDFYLANTENDIMIQGTFSEFPNGFAADDKFGLLLRKPGVAYDGETDDEPEDDKPLCLTIQFSVDSSLEPHWNIVCNRCEPKPISNKDRTKLAVGCVGDNCAKDMTWGRYSVLQKYADSKKALQGAYTQAMREAASNVDLTMLDDISDDIKKIGELYGVGFENDIRTKLSVQNGSFNASAGLYDGRIPVSLRGRGSQRLLSMGLNVGLYPEGTVLLIDEIEHGLEPYRLRSLINELRNQANKAGQIIITTHSPVVLTECNASELAVVHVSDGKTKVHYFGTDNGKTYEQLQGQIRSDADAFLCKSLIVCEGKTEQGFIKALDDYLAQNHGIRMAYKGIGIAYGGGENTFSYADAFRKCGYGIAIFMDSDKSSEDAKKEEVQMLYGTPIFDWNSPNSIEQQLFLDLPDPQIQQLIDIAVTEKGMASIASALRSRHIQFESKEDQIELIYVNNDIRAALGELAKKNGGKGWFKRIDLGRQLGNIVFEHFSEIDSETRLYQTVSSIIKWVKQI